jgi:hypothetical protein
VGETGYYVKNPVKFIDQDTIKPNQYINLKTHMQEKKILYDSLLEYTSQMTEGLDVEQE